MTDAATQVAEALRALADRAERGDVFAQTDLGFAVVDDGRQARTGIPEVIYGAGKDAEQIVGILRHFQSQDRPALATRVDPAVADAVRAVLPELQWEPLPRLLWWAPAGVDPFATRFDAPVVVCSAGTSDARVAREAVRCAQWFGLSVQEINDVGVAGLHRLTARLEELSAARVIVCVAGMEGALPSVLAGLVRAPVVAVPTSVGYGTQLGGWTPLLAMLNSCAAGVSVVNIDNGFGAALVAWRIVAGQS